MKPHQNLFDYYVNKVDVYKKLQEDYSLNQKYIKWCNVCFIVFLIASTLVHDDKLKNLLYFVSALSILQYVFLFIDQSNRNFLMHTIDWLEADNN